MKATTAIGDALLFFNRNFKMILTLLAPLFLVEGVISVTPVFQEKIADIMTLSQFVSYLLSPLYAALIFSYMHTIVHNVSLDYKGIYKMALALWKPFFIYSVIIYMGLMIAGAIMLKVPLLVVVLPVLIWLLSRFSLSQAILLEQNVVVTKAMDTSFKLTKNHALQLFFINVFIFSPIAVLFMLFYNSLENDWVIMLLAFFTMIATAVLNLSFYRYYIYLMTND